MQRFAPPGLLLPMVVLVAGGCANVYKMQVDSAARPDAASRVSYTVREAGLTDQPPVDPAAAGKYVRTALSAKGRFEAPRADASDMEVVYSYEIRPQRRLREWDEPVYRAPGRVEHTGPIVGEGILGRPVYADPPPEVNVDMIHHAADEVVYVKELHLVATERKPATPESPARVWDISISYEDKDPGMEKAMPLLAAAGCDLIGTNTNGPVTVRLRDKDDVVAFIKRGL